MHIIETPCAIWLALKHTPHILAISSFAEYRDYFEKKKKSDHV